MKSIFDLEKTIIYLKGYFQGRKMFQSLSALQYASEKHSKQYRKNGELYIIHPVVMAADAVAYGINDDEIIAAILSHDVAEDCNVSINDLPMNKNVKHIVFLLTFVKEDSQSKEEALQIYYENILSCKKACIIKLLDRKHNVSTMSGAFTKEKIISYIQETDDYILPLYRNAKRIYPEEASTLHLLKSHIFSVTNSLKEILTNPMYA